MKPNYRQQITDAVVGLLMGKTSAGERVYAGLDRPLDPKTEMPAIVVYTGNARRGNENYGNNLVTRMVELVVEGAVSSKPSTALPAAQTLADEIEDALDDSSLAATVHDCVWQESVADVTSHGSTTLGVCAVSYEVTVLDRFVDRVGELHDDGFTAPPTKVFSVPDHHGPDYFLNTLEPSVCGPDGCDIPAWGGERADDSTQ